MLLDLVVLLGTAGGHLQAVGNLTVGVHLVDDAAHQAGTGDRSEGATDQRASLLGALSRPVKRGIDLSQVAVDALRCPGDHTVRTGQFPTQLRSGGLQLNQHPLDFIVGHRVLRA